MIARSELCLDFVKNGVLVPLPVAAPSTDDVPIIGADGVRADVAEDEPREEAKGPVFDVLEDVIAKAADDEVVKVTEEDEGEEVGVKMNDADEVNGVSEKLESSLDVESYGVAVSCTLVVGEAPAGEEFVVAEIADPAATETAEAAEDRSELTSV
ncbi:hypothetical protein AYL99_05628 [Fonsecaea erecta]|uniref:Uncharacterized protein n=1 Tax=Fonsecaea erecta TaxID=1367422 RepID=A0A178ZMM9_9EURO|nr:hypothetical protein AYL99_05628 [Fonsecaea erecta]OAP60626.1 hypothetical protein AYL99_05628 [Fonsecaea erecta]